MIKMMFLLNILINKWGRLAVSASLLFACFSIPGWAAPPVPDAADIPRPQPTLPPQPRPAEIKQQERPAYRPAADAESVKVRVEQFVFSGNQAFSAEQLRVLLADYTGRENDLGALNQAAKIITDYYRNNGYLLALAYLPAQDIQANTVEIAVLEGSLGGLKLNGTEKLNGDFLGKMAAYHLKAGDTITEKSLVRNVTLLNSLPAIRASAQLNPGEAVGSSNVDVELQPLPAVEGYIAANTYGNRFTGREVLLAGLRLNNPAGRGDQLSLGLKNSRDDGQRGLNLGYLMPVHESGTLLSLSYNYVDYKLGGPFKQLKAKGDSQYFSAGLDQPLMRNAQGGLSAHVGGAYKRVDDNVSAFSLNNRRNVSNIDLGLFGDWFNSQGDVSYQAGLNLRAGRVDFKDEFAESLDATGAKTEGHFLKYNLVASRVQYFSNGVSLALRADYQHANKNLDSVEKIVIGGINRWRAFAELPSQADTGYMAGVEFRKNIAASPKLASLLLEGISTYGFVDFGRGRINRDALSDDNHVKSTHYGLGVDAAFTKKWLLNLTVSHQKREFDGANEENETRLWGQIEKAF